MLGEVQLEILNMVVMEAPVGGEHLCKGLKEEGSKSCGYWQKAFQAQETVRAKVWSNKCAQC